MVTVPYFLSVTLLPSFVRSGSDAGEGLRGQVPKLSSERRENDWGVFCCHDLLYVVGA